MFGGGTALPLQSTKEDQLYSTDEDGIMRFNSVVVPSNDEEQQMFLQSEKNASQIKMIKAQMKREIVKGKFPSSAPEGGMPGLRKIN